MELGRRVSGSGQKIVSHSPTLPVQPRFAPPRRLVCIDGKLLRLIAAPVGRDRAPLCLATRRSVESGPKRIERAEGDEAERRRQQHGGQNGESGPPFGTCSAFWHVVLLPPQAAGNVPSGLARASAEMHGSAPVERPPFGQGALYRPLFKGSAPVPIGIPYLDNNVADQ